MPTGSRTKLHAGDDIAFTPNDRPTVGVELELHLIDAATGELVQRAGDLLAVMAADHGGDEHPKAKHELFQSTVEIITGVCDNAGEARDDLAATLDELRSVAAPHGIVPMSAGTHPFARARDQLVTPQTRYRELIEAMQWPARRLLICGLHVHVGVRDGERAVTIINELRRHLPVLLALSTSSPFFEGEDSGLASTRAKVFESLPTAGLPPQIANWVEFELFMHTLLDSDCISSIREVWWDIRPHPDFGTIELRMCDAPSTLIEVAALAALAQSLVAWCDEQIDGPGLPDPPREWTVRENRWLAGRYGLDADLIVEHAGGVSRRPVRELATELVATLEPMADRLGSGPELAGIRTMLDTGSSTDRQRAVVERGGTLVDVVQHLVRELDDDRPQR